MSSDTVRFFVNGVRHEVARPEPTTTLLEYLRNEPGLTGTKEGCAEGDCGACTTAILELHGDGYRLRPVNACIQFLPTMDGKEVITVEGLREHHGDLHPAQQAMVDCHGSQCGFCTPGFVMSLFVLYRNANRPTRADIDQALSGNLCRCTGYRPIIEAARRMYDTGQSAAGADTDFKRLPGPATGTAPGESELIERLRGIQRGTTLDIDNGQRLVAPVDVDTLATLIETHPDATLLAGGTDVGLWHTKQYRPLPTLIYLGDVEALQTVTVDEARLVIGAGVSLADGFDALRAQVAGLDEIARRFASPPIWHTGTLVGNIANGSPIGDSMPALICLGALVRLRRGENRRTVPLDAFYTGYRQSVMQPGEFVEALEVPLPAAGAIVRSYKIAKRHDQDISAVCGAFALSLSEGIVEDVVVCYGGMAPVPQRARHAEAALRNRAWKRGVVQAAMASLADDFQPIGDMRASADYRSRVAANLLMKFFLDTTEASPVRVFDVMAAGS